MEQEYQMLPFNALYTYITLRCYCAGHLSILQQTTHVVDKPDILLPEEILCFRSIVHHLSFENASLV